LPGKNIRNLGGRPLIQWSIDAAKDIREICDILVSTDDSEIAGIARTAGALVPWLRPAALATDTASSAAVCIHALDWYEAERGRVDGLLLLQPTSPFRSRATIERGIRVFLGNGHRTVIGISPAASHPMWCFKVAGQSMRPFVDGAGLQLRSQDVPPAFEINGALYLIAPEVLRRQRGFYSDEVVPLVMEKREESLDIDTEWDWNLAQAMLAANAARPA
jgi:N-acylneuraminate cytidylyltransferase